MEPVDSLPPPPDRPRRILVIDDDDGRREMLAKLFTYEGYEVDLFSDASDVLEHCIHHPPDLIILDVLLVGISGLEVCGDLRMSDHLRLTPIILMSAACNDEESVVRGLLGGADDYFVTPSRLSELKARVRVQLRNRRDRELLQWARSQRADFRDAAMCDALTGLPNRRSADLALSSALASSSPFMVLLMDVDHFKKINDTHGHVQGDAVLRELGHALRRIGRTSDTIARFGGEEFVVLARGAPAHTAYTIGERFRSGVARMTMPKGCPVVGITVSVGIAFWGGVGMGPTAENLLAAADEALYRAKREGRNRVVVSEKSLMLEPSE